MNLPPMRRGIYCRARVDAQPTVGAEAEGPRVLFLHNHQTLRPFLRSQLASDPSGCVNAIVPDLERCNCSQIPEWKS